MVYKELSLWLKEKKITTNKGWATKKKLTKNVNARGQCIKLGYGPIDSWRKCQKYGPPIKVVNGV
jgi:hypothetical protein